MKNITVFCGSSLGTEPEFENQAKKLGQTLALEKIGLVYGGAKIGLMGAVAQGALESQGEVIGIIPRFLQKKEVVHEELSELIIVESMHERKQKMFDLSDGFIILPGGLGTLEEFFEVLTWAQLGRHKKPIGILNTNGYYDELFSFIHKMIDKQFVRPLNLELFLVSESIDGLLIKMKNYQAPPLPRWMKKE
jgi:uncharacterized protein (TIGR00730 family)